MASERLLNLCHGEPAADFPESATVEGGELLDIYEPTLIKIQYGERD